MTRRAATFRKVNFIRAIEVAERYWEGRWRDEAARVKELEGALQAARKWMIPGMNWSDEIGKAVIQQVDAALVKKDQQP